MVEGLQRLRDGMAVAPKPRAGGGAAKAEVK